jgi:hypothetical protein
MSCEGSTAQKQQPELFEVFVITTKQELTTTSQHIAREKNLKTDE